MGSVSAEVGITILKQLGTGMICMIGAHKFVYGDTWVSFCYKAKAKDGSTCCKVTLDPDDTYTVEFYRIRGGLNPSAKVLSTTSFVHVDQLPQLFESTTGLYLSLRSR